MKTIESTHRIFIVDDHPVVRDGIRALLDAPGCYSVCGEAASPAQALRQLTRTPADCAIVDLMFKHRKCLDIISDIHRACPQLPIVVLSMLDRSTHEREARAAGAYAYIEKHEPPVLLVQTLDRIFANEHPRREKSRPELTTLTPRERAIFEALGRGLDKHHIAAELGIHVKTVESHREAIKHKLGISSCRELVRVAVQTRSGN
ncbi:MAG: response regulator transcription factor [Chthoniobacterales bacterium]